MKILYSGGGTMGSVSPLIAINQKLKLETRNLKLETLWLGTKNGIEKDIVEKEGIDFRSISAGKLRRYFDFKNIIDIFKIKVGFFQAFFIIKKFKPDVIVSAGSFIAVPVVVAGWVLRVPSIIHQQDVRVGLANKIMAKFAKRITVALDTSLKDFSKSKTTLAGNPVRLSAFATTVSPPSHEATADSPAATTDKLNDFLSFGNNLPTLLIIGGGTGALKLNELVWQSLEDLIKLCNIIHITGKNKNDNRYQISDIRYQNNYKNYEFLNDEIFSAMAQADLVITRAGMSALTELAYLKKLCIIVPIPNSHQEKNAEYFSEKGAGIYLKQNELDKIKFVEEVKKLLENKNMRYELGYKMNKIFCDYSGERIIEIIQKLLL
jgi:UDP-N-acetylglucosamine--N-acetylmuramyl-(pentapeptide) pyrophosphoryl-undecaprenol N-acetylglucosamine transferase